MLFFRSGIKMESLRSTASKTNEVINIISEKLNHMVDVVEETLEKLHNNPRHVPLVIHNEGPCTPMINEFQRKIINS